MTREEVKAIFPEATEEQVTAYLNAHHTEIGKIKAPITDDALAELRRKATEFEKQELAAKTAEERLADEMAKAEQYRIDNQKLLNRTKAIGVFAETGLVEADYSDILDGIVTSDEETTLKIANKMAEIIKNKITETENKTKEHLGNLPTPPAGGDGNAIGSFGRTLGEEANKTSNLSQENFQNLVKI